MKKPKSAQAFEENSPRARRRRAFIRATANNAVLIALAALLVWVYIGPAQKPQIAAMIAITAAWFAGYISAKEFSSDTAKFWDGYASGYHVAQAELEHAHRNDISAYRSIVEEMSAGAGQPAWAAHEEPEQL